MDVRSRAVDMMVNGRDPTEIVDWMKDQLPLRPKHELIAWERDQRNSIVAEALIELARDPSKRDYAALVSEVIR